MSQRINTSADRVSVNKEVEACAAAWSHSRRFSPASASVVPPMVRRSYRCPTPPLSIRPRLLPRSRSSAAQAVDSIYPSTDYSARVVRLAKGSAPETITIRSLGTTGSEPFVVHGSPHFRVRERALVFLVSGPDGTYQVMHLALGLFRQARLRGRALALGHVSRVNEIPNGQNVSLASARHSVRDLESFIAWIADRDNSIERAADYELTISERDWQSLSSPFTLLGDVANLQFNGRWFNFDGGGSVVWTYDSRGDLVSPVILRSSGAMGKRA